MEFGDGLTTRGGKTGSPNRQHREKSWVISRLGPEGCRRYVTQLARVCDNKVVTLTNAGCKNCKDDENDDDDDGDESDTRTFANGVRYLN